MTQLMPAIEIQNLRLVRASVAVTTPFHKENMDRMGQMALAPPRSTLHRHVSQGHDPPHASD